MKQSNFFSAFLALVIAIVINHPVVAEVSYEVNVTNLTGGQVFSPILVFSHIGGLKAFRAGNPAIAELVAIAEEGDTAPALSALSKLTGTVKDAKDSGGPLAPGKTTTVSIEGGDGITHLTVLSMLVFSNDAFLALNGESLPTGNEPVSFYLNAYDAGSEANDENCGNVPGQLPDECASPATKGEGEGFVHIHAGIHGVGDLSPAKYDWRNPVAKVTIQRIEQ